MGFCDSNWGLQDASHPTGKPDNILNIKEAQSLQGALIIQLRGAFARKEMLEKRVSWATCEAEIKSLDKCTRFVQALWLVFEDLGMSNIAKPALIYNDNQGSSNWGKGWANRRMCHMKIRNMAVRDAHEHHQEIDIKHIEGKLNPANILTKEHRSAYKKFIYFCEVMVPQHPDGGHDNLSKTAKAG
jgi:hypothetical protein